MGKENTADIFNDNPIEQAKLFEKLGCERIHIIDLDAAFGRSELNKKTILKIRDAVSSKIQLGGGIRETALVDFWIKEGINYLIIGSLSISNTNLVLNISKKHPNKIYIAVDSLNKKIMIEGWKKETDVASDQIIKDFNNSDARGFVYTDIERDGMLSGINIEKTKEVLKHSKKNIIIAGGLSDYKDIKNLLNLQNNKIEGVIAGKAYYLGKIDISEAKKIINNNA